MKKNFCGCLPEKFFGQGDSIFDRGKSNGEAKKASAEGKIAWAQAQKIALESQVSLKRVGEGLNQLKIKIHQRQLGCFQAGQKVRGANGDGLTR